MKLASNFSIAICFAAFLSASLHATFPSEGLDTIPKELRSSLKVSVERLVEVQRKEDWYTFYDELLPPQEKAKRTKESFLRDLKNTSGERLLSFEPTSAVSYGPWGEAEGRWDLSGCMTVLKGDKKSQFQGDTSVQLIKGHWYFLVPLGPSYNGIDSLTKIKCSNPKKSSAPTRN